MPRPFAKPLIVAALVTAAAGVLLAGPLDPPTGPVASTYKTLSEVEPRTAVNATNTPGDADSLYKITQPGSYYLTGNITGVASKHGIEIAASGVTLDLNGFELLGVDQSLDGVTVGSDFIISLGLLNGSVRNWDGDGVDFKGNLTNIHPTRVSDIRASYNAGRGIAVSRNAVVTDCTVYFNAGIGLLTDLNCSVSRCSASANGSHGIQVGASSSVSDCAVRQSVGSGIKAQTSSILNCSASLNAIGIDADGGAVSRCTAYQNSGNGISMTEGSVTDCSATSNNLNGIACQSNSLIRGNQCTNNNEAGIYVTGGGNHIEGNTCTAADRGIDIDAAGNIIIRNTCAGNGVQWTIVVGNAIAPIVLSAASATPVNGAFYAGSLGVTDPNSNVTY